jgi:hypothetical protein
MVKGEAVMAIAIKPLRRRRRTTQRGKSIKSIPEMGEGSNNNASTRG